MRVDSLIIVVFFFFKQKTAYEMRISDWSSDVCSSDLPLDSEAGQCRDARGILEYARQISIAAGLEHGCRDHRPTPLPAWRRWRQFVHSHPWISLEPFYRPPAGNAALIAARW